MPWKACHKVDEKLKFVSRFADGEKIAFLRREFGISWVTGHRIIDPYPFGRGQYAGGGFPNDGGASLLSSNRSAALK